MKLKSNETPIKKWHTFSRSTVYEKDTEKRNRSDVQERDGNEQTMVPITAAPIVAQDEEQRLRSWLKTRNNSSVSNQRTGRSARR